MGNKQAIITINGKKYDARTGQLLEPSPSKTKKAPAKPSVKAVAKKPEPAKKPRVMSDISRTPAAPIRRRTPARSQTLMRTAVKKPAKVPAAKKPVAPVHNTAAKKPAAPTPRIQHFDIARHTRALNVRRSDLVSKFNNSPVIQNSVAAAQTAVTERIERLPVQPAPAIKAATSQVQAVLEKGLKNAQSHTETFKPDKKTKRTTSKRRKSRVANLAAGTLAAVLLFGFIAYQNVPNISVRYAAARSGVQATLPGYRPSGFAMSNRIQYNPGQITISFASNSDSRAFNITQRETSWNSEALLSNYVSTKSDQVQKYEDRGRTIFIYDNNNATWVNGGVWYDINGDSQLNSDQLIRIATSM